MKDEFSSDIEVVSMLICVGVWEMTSLTRLLFPFQTGESTPGITGWLEVYVADELVHSKKVCEGRHSCMLHVAWGRVGVLGMVVFRQSQY